jgi:putative tryptophan/tyrosine transport system substrate-binding protein
VITRRKIVIALGTGVLAAPFASFAQQKPGKILRVGRLSPVSAATDAPSLEPLLQALRGFGWVQGENLAMEYRFADGKLDRLPELAAELVQLKVDVIVSGSTQGALAASNATRTIPIVMVTTGDPVASGLVASLARPGRNLTGVTTLAQELSAKQLELIREIVPGVTRVAVLANPTNPDAAPSVKGVEIARRALGLQLQVLEVSAPAELDKAFAAMNSAHAKALIVVVSPMFHENRAKIAALAAKYRLPAIFGLREFVEAGGLMFYGASLPEMYRHAATYVDKILKGAKPADLPVEQPTKFELVVNMKTAKTLGVKIPNSILLRADKVIE